MENKLDEGELGILFFADFIIREQYHRMTPKARAIFLELKCITEEHVDGYFTAKEARNG